ncbi:MAG TPA: DNA alkylation repair protein [Saprospiraceae bacterium]|nr:DNA alkylation repair protein [Saprospiraceae bacterium]HMQ83637.1 DNA alkylation repair protein [Saprospiraceae bacterium]
MPSSMLLPNDYLNEVKRTFEQAGKPDVADGQMAYMRHQFEFYGLKMPVWSALAKEIFQKNGLPEGKNLHQLALLCMQDDYREVNYFGLELVQKQLKKQDENLIELLETLIQTRSWWDSVDWLAKLVGMHFLRYPVLIQPVTSRWMDSGYMWLQRVCLIFQLTYKDKTDAALLFQYIAQLKGSKEFFIQKAAGWALRQYSKTHPEVVRGFLNEQPDLPALTRREAIKYLPQ